MSENPFWDYSLVFYSRPEVAKCCLDYQDQHEANVNILLLCCWLGSLGVLIKSHELEQASLAINSIELHAVQPLRAVRQFIKKIKPPEEKLYHKLQQVELMAEQIVQNDLLNWSLRNGLITDKKFTGKKKVISSEVALSAKTKNLNTYLSLLGCRFVSTNSPLCNEYD